MDVDATDRVESVPDHAVDQIAADVPKETSPLSPLVPPPPPPQESDAGLLLQPISLSRTVSPAILDSESAPATFSDPQDHTPLDRNITDAFSYLDAVKVQFQDQPNVYNHFFGIMKEFKSQLIDTPGVIKRIANLFNGHPALIQGFNTFVPVGYRIECSTGAPDANYITVITPTGTIMQTTNNGPGKDPILWSTTDARTSPSTSVPVASPTRPPPTDPKPEGQTIDPAVQYVLKAEQHCDAETYRQFLDILSPYHHKPNLNAIDEEEVSKQIAHLFKDAPNLRSDFRVFMPEKCRQLLDDIPTSSSRTDEGKQRKSEPAPGDEESSLLSSRTVWTDRQAFHFNCHSFY